RRLLPGDDAPKQGAAQCDDRDAGGDVEVKNDRFELLIGAVFQQRLEQRANQRPPDETVLVAQEPVEIDAVGDVRTETLEEVHASNPRETQKNDPFGRTYEASSARAESGIGSGTASWRSLKVRRGIDGDAIGRSRNCASVSAVHRFHCGFR